MSNYIFENNAEDRELTRLQMVEAAIDPATINTLKGTGITTGWKCLEIGPVRDPS